MKINKPRNHITLAMNKRNGAGAHYKPNKAKRLKLKNSLHKELRKPPTFEGGFLFSKIVNTQYFFYVK